MVDYCHTCQKPIPEEKKQRKGAKGHKVKFCDDKCRKEFSRLRYLGLNRRPDLPAPTIRAINELRVILDLLSKKFEVFRAISSRASCNLAIAKDGKFHRVAIRTGFYSSAGSIHCSKLKDDVDILAIVLWDKIVYRPPLSD